MVTCKVFLEILLYIWQHCFIIAKQMVIIIKKGGILLATFGQRLKQLRTKKDNMSLEFLAEKIETTKATLSRYENGKRIPNIDFAKKIAAFFGVTTDFLYGLTDDEKGKVSEYDDIIGFADKSQTNAKILREYIEFLNSQKDKID